MKKKIMSQGSLNPKIPSSKTVVSSSRTDRQTETQTDRHTDRQMKVNTEGTFSGFQDFFLQPIIKDRPNISYFEYSLFQI